MYSLFYHVEMGVNQLDNLVLRTDLAGCRIVNFYKHSRVLHYDLSRGKGYVTVQKKSQLWKNIFKLMYKSVKFLIMYPHIRKGYKNHLSDLTK